MSKTSPPALAKLGRGTQNPDAVRHFGWGGPPASYNADDEASNESYDANGNTTRTANGNSYTYDSENHMLSMTSGSTVVTMVYDAFGNRVSKTVNGVTTQYLVEDDVNPTGLPQVLDEIVNGTVQRTYTYGLQRISENQLVNNAWTPSFYGYDGAGTVRQLIDSAGAVTDTYDYDAFGNLVSQTGTTPNNYLYRGEQWDPDLSLYYLRGGWPSQANLGCPVLASLGREADHGAHAHLGPHSHLLPFPGRPL